MINRLIKANLEKNVKYVDEVLDMLVDLKNTWLQAVANLKEKPHVEVPENYVNIVN
jgi:flagellin-specific chaperone FliS